MRYRVHGRKSRLDVQTRRVAIRMILAVVAFLTFGLLSWLLLGRPHRHGRRWHWDRDMVPEAEPLKETQK